MENKKKEYDFIIVGSGVGGLITSVVLAMEGYSVLVLEKNHQIGGSLQVFSRDKVIFDTGVHYIGSLDEGETLRKIFSYVGIFKDLKIKRLDDDCFDMIRLSDGTSYKYGQGYENFRSGLISHFPNEITGIDLFLTKIQGICSEFPLYNLDVEDGFSYMDKPELMSESAFEFVQSISTDVKLQSVLLGNGLLYAGEVQSTPLYVLALIMNSYLKGSYRLENGGSQIAKLLTKRLHGLGGSVLKHKEVVSAQYTDGLISSIETKDGEEYFAKNFISNMHPQQTIEVFGADHFRPAYLKRLNKLENTVSSFMLYLSFHKESFPYLNYNMYSYTTKDVWNTVDYKKEDWPQSIFICTSAVKGQGVFSDSMSVMAYMNYDEVKKWNSSFNTVAEASDRGKEYSQFKREKEEQVILKLEEVFPNIRKSIKGIYCSTPLTYKDYIGTSDGSLYGIKKDYNQIMRSKINSKTRVPNLFLTGQNLVFHGVLGASIGALVCSFNFIEDHYLINKINNTK